MSGQGKDSGGGGIVGASGTVGDDLILSIPYINIHAFCISEESAATLQEVATDRRMSRATVDVYVGDVSAAIGFYQNAVTPDVLFIEFEHDPEMIKTGLADLAEVCDPKTRVIVIGRVNDVLLYRSLVEMGVNEYIVSPISHAQILRVIGALYVDSDTALGRVIAFVGAKGGVGSSTIAHNCAWLISKVYGSKVVIADLDFPFGTSGLDFDIPSGKGLLDILASPDRLDQVMLDRLLEKYDEDISLLGMAGQLWGNFDFSLQAYEVLIDLLRKAAPFIVLDVPHGWDTGVRTALVAADSLVMVVEPDLANARNAKDILAFTKTRRPNESAPYIVFNKVGVPGRPEVSVPDCSQVLGCTPVATINFDAQVFYGAANEGKLVVEQFGQSRAAESILDIVSSLMGRRAMPKKQEKESVMSKVLGKFNIRMG